MKRNLCYLLLGLMLTSVGQAINLQNYYFSDAYKYAIIEDSFILKHPGDWLVTLSGAYVGEPLVVVTDENSTNKEHVVINNHMVGTLGFNYHVTRWLSLRVDSHYLMQTMSNDPVGNQEAINNINSTAATSPAYAIDPIGEKSSGLGDIGISAKIRLLNNRKSRLALAFIPRVEINNGNLKLFNTSDQIAFGGMFVLEKYLTKRFGVQLAAGYRQTEQNELGVIDYDKMLRGQFGLTYRLSRSWNVNFEFDHRETISEDSLVGIGVNSKQNSSDFYLTAKGKIAKPVSLYAGVGVAGFAESDIGNFTGFLGLKLHPGAKKRVKKVKEPVVETPSIELASLEDQTVVAGSSIIPLNADLTSGGDMDGNGNSVAYACSYDQVIDDAVIAGSPCTNLNGLMFDTSTGNFSWTPGAEYAKQEFEFKIDGYMNGDLFDSEMFVIRVTEPEVVAPEPAVPEVLQETLRIAETVEFDTNKATIRSYSKPSLDQAAAKIIEYQDQIGTIEIQGHTDTRGAASYNLNLSQRRADSVRNYLIRKGVPSSKLRATGYGETEPLIVPEVTTEDYQANRRTVFVVEEVIQVSQ